MVSHNVPDDVLPLPFHAMHGCMDARTRIRTRIRTHIRTRARARTLCTYSDSLLDGKSAPSTKDAEPNGSTPGANTPLFIGLIQLVPKLLIWIDSVTIKCVFIIIV